MNIQLFTELFKGRTDVYGTDNLCIRSPLTESLIESHLKGKKRIGVYPLLIDKCNFIVIDIDTDDLELAKSYHKTAKKYGLICYVENSKQKGYHCWHFFDSLISAKKARSVIKYIFAQSKHTYEIFPKQDYTTDVGNYINLPLFNEGKDKRTVFLDSLNGFSIIDDQWRFLASIERNQPAKIDEIIKKYKISAERQFRQSAPSTLSNTDIDLMKRDFINRAIQKANIEGRNNAGLDLANQLRDHDISEYEAREVMLRYQSLVSTMKSDPYSEKEAMQSLTSSYKGTKRESWWKPPEQKSQAKSEIQGDKAIAQVDTEKLLLEKAKPFPIPDNELCHAYIEIMKDVSEAPASYHIFTLLTILGMVLNRNLYIQWGFDRIYPNLWVMIVGQTGRARKSSTINKGRILLEDSAPELQILSSLSTWEGLLYAMQRKNDEIGNKPEITLVCMSEFDGFLKKSRQESISYLIPHLCDLYDCRAKEQNVTQSKPLVVNNPFLSIIAGIQPEVLEESFKKGDVHGGFAGRFMYVYDSSDKEIPVPKWDKQKEFNNIKLELVVIKQREATPEIKINSDCLPMWEQFYHNYRNQTDLPALLLQLNDRIQNHVLKLAMLFSVLDKTDTIGIKQLKEAIAIGEWLMDNNKRLFGTLGSSESEKLELKILDLIAGGICNRRTLYQKVSGRVSSRDLQYAIEGLKKTEVIIEKTIKNPRGRSTKVLLINQE